MSLLFEITQYYFLIQVLIVGTYLTLHYSPRLLQRRKLALPALSLRNAHHLLILVVLIMPLLASHLVDERVFRAPVQVWSDVAQNSAATKGSSEFLVSFTAHPGKESLMTQSLAVQYGCLALWILIAAMALLHFGRIAIALAKLRSLKLQSFRLRRIGHVEILVSRSVTIPFTAGAGRSAAVFLPEYLIADAEHLKATVAHEFQHLRHSDLAWTFLLEVFRGFSFLNPIAHAWTKEIQELHEFACDEALLGQQRIDPTAYARCLFEVASYAQHLGKSAPPLGTVGMSVPQKHLKRRIEMIFETRKPTLWLGKALVAASLLMTGTLAVAAKNIVADRRITLTEAKELAEKTNKDSTIPVEIDENVLRMLNKGVGTERGRMYLRASFKRMKTFESMIRRKLLAAHLPEELLSIPIVESGYQSTDNGVGAGIWAFIPGTARHFGLRVDDEVDQRFDSDLETDAAVKYYTKLYQEFKDWPLALLAYNAGENSVREAIAKTGIHDALRLVREHHMPKEQEYLPMTMAAIIAFKNPSLLEE